MSEVTWYTLNALKLIALETGQQFVHIVMPGNGRVMLIGDHRTGIYKMGAGDVVDEDARFYYATSIPTTFRFPNEVYVIEGVNND